MFESFYAHWLNVECLCYRFNSESSILLLLLFLFIHFSLSWGDVQHEYLHDNSLYESLDRIETRERKKTNCVHWIKSKIPTAKSLQRPNIFDLMKLMMSIYWFNIQKATKSFHIMKPFTIFPGKFHKCFSGAQNYFHCTENTKMNTKKWGNNLNEDQRVVCWSHTKCVSITNSDYLTSEKMKNFLFSK